MQRAVNILPAEPANPTVPPKATKATPTTWTSYAARARGRPAFHLLVDRHGQNLYRLAYSLSGNATDADDLLQESLGGAFKGLGRFEALSVKTWLTALMTGRPLAARVAGEGGDVTDDSGGRRVGVARFAEPAARRGDEAERVGQRVDLHAALQTLSPEHREVLVLREFEGLSYEEMAKAFASTRGTVESRLHRAGATNFAGG